MQNLFHSKDTIKKKKIYSPSIGHDIVVHSFEPHVALVHNGSFEGSNEALDINADQISWMAV